MKKLLFVLLCLVSAVTARAEDIIQAVPFRAEPGLTTDDAFCFSVRMILRSTTSTMMWVID